MCTEITTWSECKYVCIAIYLSFHMAVSLDDIITLWVEVQRSMIVDHLFSPKEFWWIYGKLQQASHRQTVANSSIDLDYINQNINTKLHWPYNHTFVVLDNKENLCNQHTYLPLKCWIWVWERPLMTSHVFWPFFTYLSTLSYSLTSHLGGYLGPPYRP